MINWRIESACSSITQELSNGTVQELLIEFNWSAIERICIGLSLLNERLISGLDLIDLGQTRLQVVSSQDSRSILRTAPYLKLSLQKSELERWLHFLLRTVRDGAAEVDHIDLEVRLAEEPSMSADVTVLFPVFAPPVTGDEAAKRLGLR